jgi:hypothetical protein
MSAPVPAFCRTRTAPVAEAYCWLRLRIDEESAQPPAVLAHVLDSEAKLPETLRADPALGLIAKAMMPEVEVTTYDGVTLAAPVTLPIRNPGGPFTVTREVCPEFGVTSLELLKLQLETHAAVSITTSELLLEIIGAFSVPPPAPMLFETGVPVGVAWSTLYQLEIPVDHEFVPTVAIS